MFAGHGRKCPKNGNRNPDTPGIVAAMTSGYNQNGTVVIAFRRTVTAYQRGEAPVLPQPDLK